MIPALVVVGVVTTGHWIASHFLVTRPLKARVAELEAEVAKK